MSQVITITANKMESYRVNWASGPNELVQGYYNNGTTNIWWGHFWFSAADLIALRAAINDQVRVESVELYFARDNTSHGAQSPTPVKVYCTSLTTASGTPSTGKLSSGIVIGSLDRGEGKWCPMSTVQLDHLLKGGNGFCTYHNSVNTAATDYSYYVRSTTKPKLRVTYSPVASVGTLTASTVDAGSPIVLTITPFSPEFGHKLTWKFGGNALTQTLSPGTTGTSYVVPLDWLSAIPSATSGTASVTLATMQGDIQVGDAQTYSFTVTVPASVVPSIGALTATRIDNGVPAAWGLYVQGKSKAVVAVEGAAGAHGSTIASYTITGGGFSSSASSLTTGVLSDAGTVTFTATVRDTRGRAASGQVSITVYAYASPSFASVAAFRCTSGGVASNDGTYFKLTAAYSFSSVNGKNTVSCSARYRKGSTGVLSNATMIASGVAVTLGGGAISADSDYDVVLTLTDGIGTVTHVENIPSAAYTMHFKKGGKSVAFGQAATSDEAVEINPAWAFYAGGRNLAALTPEMIGAMPAGGGASGGSVELVPGSGTGKAVVECGPNGELNLHSYGNAVDAANRRFIQLRNARTQASMDNALVVVNSVSGALTTYRIFHEGMATPIPVALGGTGNASPKAALVNLGIFYAPTLPPSGVDGQICLVPV